MSCRRNVDRPFAGNPTELCVRYVIEMRKTSKRKNKNKKTYTKKLCFFFRFSTSVWPALLPTPWHVFVAELTVSRVDSLAESKFDVPIDDKSVPLRQTNDRLVANGSYHPAGPRTTWRCEAPFAQTRAQRAPRSARRQTRATADTSERHQSLEMPRKSS